MTSDTNRHEPTQPPPTPGAGWIANPSDATQPAFPAVAPAQQPALPSAPPPQAPTGSWAAPEPSPTTPAQGVGWAAATPPTPPSASPTAAWLRPEPDSPPPAGSSWTTPGSAPAASYGPPPVAPSVPYAAQPARARRGVTPVALAVAIVATAVLTAGTTYVAVEAAHPSATASVNQLAVAQPSGGTGTATTPGVTGTATPSLTPANPVPANGQGSIPAIVAAVSPAVVTITAEGATTTDPVTGQTTTGTAVGSGIIFDSNGLVLTNHHVVAGSPSKLTVTLKDGRTLNASVYGVDTLTDLAIVKVQGASGLPTAPIGSSAGIQVGQQSIAIGSPLGDLTGSVTSGIVSALGRQITAEGENLDNLIQTDTPINPGNSGGPLLDAGGNVIGINTAVSSNAQNIGFAIPIDIAKPLLAEASAGKPLARAWLGVRFETIDPTMQQAISLPVANGALIPTTAQLQQLQAQANGGTGSSGNGTNPFGRGGGSAGSGSAGSGSASSAAIVAGSPAQQAGLAAGDIVTAVNGTSLDATHTLDLLLGELTPGQQVTLTVLRNGQTSSVTVTLGTRPQSV